MNEFNTPKKEFHDSKEFSTTPNPNAEFSTFQEKPKKVNSTSGSEAAAKRHRRTLMMQSAAVCSSIVLIAAAFGIDFLKTDPLGKNNLVSNTEALPEIDFKPEPSPAPLPPDSDEDANVEGDTSFPALDNLDPDTSIEQQYIFYRRNKDDEAVWLVAGNVIADYYGITAEEESSGDIYYTASTNTLTLDNITVDFLQVNLMGNGFKLELIGENHVSFLDVWGYGYGGSITITGNGSLAINKDMTYPIGFRMEAENSESCLMVDKDVTLDIYGTDAALIIASTTADKPVYYIRPLKMTGGTLECGKYKLSVYAEYDDVDEWGYKTPNGELSTHITFQ